MPLASPSGAQEVIMGLQRGIVLLVVAALSSAFTAGAAAAPAAGGCGPHCEAVLLQGPPPV